jgi:hypothetical protein
LMQMAHAFDNQLHNNRLLSSASSSDNNSSTNSQLLPQKMVMISRTPTNSSSSSDQETISKSSLTQTYGLRSFLSLNLFLFSSCLFFFSSF